MPNEPYDRISDQLIDHEKWAHDWNYKRYSEGMIPQDLRRVLKITNPDKEQDNDHNKQEPIN